jgi:hypothetical protein
MKLTLIILSFLLLFQKSNTQAASVRTGHMVAVKAFVLERKKVEGLSTLCHSTTALSQQGIQDSESQLLLCDIEEEEDNYSFNIKKFKLLCGFYLAPPSIYQFDLSCITHQVKTLEGLNSQIFCTKYLVQRSLRI